MVYSSCTQIYTAILNLVAAKCEEASSKDISTYVCHKDIMTVSNMLGFEGHLELDGEEDRKSRLNSSHSQQSRMPSSA